MIKLARLLMEVGEATSTPYGLKKSYEPDEESAEYTFTTDEGLLYVVTVIKHREEAEESMIDYEVSFGVYGAKGLDFKTERGNVKAMYRIMATVVKALYDAIEWDAENGDTARSVFMKPTKSKKQVDPKTGRKTVDKSDRRRADFYVMYLKKNLNARFPGATVTSSESGDYVKADLLFHKK